MIRKENNITQILSHLFLKVSGFWGLLIIMCFHSAFAQTNSTGVDSIKTNISKQISETINTGLNCSQRLNLAEDLFARGKLEEIPSTLEECLKGNNFSDDEQERALHLLFTIYAIEADSAADSVFQELIDAFPEHSIDLAQTVDPAELTYIYDHHRTWPFMYLTAEAGVNTSWVFPKEPAYGVDNTQTGDIKTKPYSTRQGIHVGIYADIPITPRSFRASLGVYFTERRYDYEDSLQTIRPVSNNFANLTFSEKQQWLSFPLMISWHLDKRSRYNFQKKRIYPYFSIGLAPQWLLKSNLSEIRRTNRGIETQSGFQTPELEKGKITQLRNRLNMSLIAAVGMQYKFGLDYIIFQLRYEQFLRNIVNPSNRYNLPELVYTYGHVDNNFFLSSATFTVGYNLTLYEPKKLKEPRHKP